MSAFKKAAKSKQKTHRERSQPAAREHLGILEKKKDYRQRAAAYHKKERTLLALKRKAQDKNPNEFYFKMINSKLQDGVHHNKADAPEYTDIQMKLMHTQDIRYIHYKRGIEMNKIEKLKQKLHLLDEKPVNKHTYFVDSKKECKQFDLADHLNTDPSLVGQVYNRRTKDQTVQGKPLNPEIEKRLKLEKLKKEDELKKRIEREKQLNIVAQKLEVKRHLLDKVAKKKKVQSETVESAAVYKWVPRRKK